jgi:hypothetical protein
MESVVNRFLPPSELHLDRQGPFLVYKLFKSSTPNPAGISISWNLTLYGIDDASFQFIQQIQISIGFSLPLRQIVVRRTNSLPIANKFEIIIP